MIVIDTIKIPKKYHNSSIPFITAIMFWYLHWQISPPTKGTQPIDNKVYFQTKKVQKNWNASLDICDVFTPQKQAILGQKSHKNVKITKGSYKTDLPQRERCWICTKYVIVHSNTFFQQFPLWTTRVILDGWFEICGSWFCQKFWVVGRKFGCHCVPELILGDSTQHHLFHFMVFIQPVENLRLSIKLNFKTRVNLWKYWDKISQWLRFSNKKFQNFLDEVVRCLNRKTQNGIASSVASTLASVIWKSDSVWRHSVS